MSAAAEPVKRKRSYGPKTRTGCQTCKIRRVKCDEAKPHCVRCSSTGRHCDGYAQVQSLLQQPPKARDSTAIARLPTMLHGTKDEKRSFEYFITRTGAELSGFYSGDFWEQLLLQASAGEPSLRHAVIAIGGIHEEFSNRRLALGDQNVSRGHAFAVGQYSKALGHLRRSLATGKQAPLTALMTCILFVCFDSLRGQFHTALIHLQSGLKILRDMRKRSVEDEYMINRHIAPLFTRMSLQAILFIDTREHAERQALVVEMADVTARCPPMPESFSTLDEARKYMDQTANDLFRVTYMCDGEKPLWEQPALAHELFARYSSGTTKWNVVFERFMRAKSASLTTRELRGAALLKIHHMTAHIMSEQTPLLADCRPMAAVMNDRNSFLKYSNEFKTIVALCRTLMSTEDQDVKNGKARTTFSSDLGVVGPLYYVCVRCQDMDIRHQALELLARNPRREGMWDSESGVKMITQFWELERHHASLVKDEDPATAIPLVAVVDLGFHDGKWEWKLKNFTASWNSREGSIAASGVGGSESNFMSSPGEDWLSLLDDDSWLGSMGTPSDSGVSGMSWMP